MVKLNVGGKRKIAFVWQRGGTFKKGVEVRRSGWGKYWKEGK